jgi:CHAT domain
MMPAAIRVELLRVGTAQNHLLSPGTPYIALVDNQPACEVRVPFEHGHFVELYEDFRQAQGDATAKALDKLRDALALFLSAIVPLREAVASAKALGSTSVEIRLVLSATELAVLPFEVLPNWQDVGLVFTREARRRALTALRYREPPRVLVVASSAGGVIPLDANLLALRRALAPWVVVGSLRSFKEYVTLCDNASLDDVRRACTEALSAGRPYTHVHVLAHGAPYGPRFAPYFGLAMRGDDGVWVASAQDLLSALCIERAPPGERLPSVVTLAACDSGNPGSVLGPPSSLAQRLHEGGVPIVFASQVPLSFEGSAVLTEAAYGGLLWGLDPRDVLRDVRKGLQTRLSFGTDAAGIVLYVSLSRDFEAQQVQVQRRMTQRAVDVLIAEHDPYVVLPDQEPRDAKVGLGNLGRLRDDIAKQAPACSPTHGGSAWRRLAEIAWGALAEGTSISVTSSAMVEFVWEPLRFSAEAYGRAFAEQPWVGSLIKSLASHAFRGGDLDETSYRVARAMTDYQARATPNDPSWLRCHVDLALLAIAYGLDEVHELDELKRLVRRAARDAPRAWDTYSLSRQLRRHQAWCGCWGEPLVKGKKASEVAQQLLDELDRAGAISTWSAVVEWWNDDDRVRERDGR